MRKKWTGERLETYIYSRDTTEHLHRYAITFDFIKNKKVLDIASGEGYGSHLMSKFAALVCGVDIDKGSIESAKIKYNASNLIYKNGSITQIPFNDYEFDVIVSFETLEHLKEHDKMMSEIKRVLKKDGILIISTPDKKYYSDVKNFNNKYHLKELYKEEFRNLLNNFFDYCDLYIQTYLSGISVISSESNATFRDNVYYGDYQNIVKATSTPLYLVAIVSNYKLNKIEPSFFDGSNVIMHETFTRVKNSNTYKLGHFILGPLKAIKKILKKL